ncbi:MAG TPA: LapA family protein [Acidimicrobiales bacterium]|jgi:uncharacterized integral membrane protein|nr:LapA family protein [Acidimicrobiales bacterium]
MNEQSQSPVSPRLVVGALLVVLLVVFTLENRQQTKIRFILPEVKAPLWVALLGAALIGAVAGALLSRHRRDV